MKLFRIAFPSGVMIDSDMSDKISQLTGNTLYFPLAAMLLTSSNFS